MDKEEIKREINKAIREHEIRVAWISGLLGSAVIAGIFHAIALLRWG